MPRLEFSIPFLGNIAITPDERLFSIFQGLRNKLQQEHILPAVSTAGTVILTVLATLLVVWLFRNLGNSQPQPKKLLDKPAPMLPKRKPSPRPMIHNRRDSTYPPGIEVDHVMEDLRKSKPDLKLLDDAAAASSAAQQIQSLNTPFGQAFPRTGQTGAQVVKRKRDPLSYGHG
jgi:hypothetical protein